MSNNLFKYFKHEHEFSLPSPSGHLSHTMPSSMIQATNDSVLSVVSTAEENGCCDWKKRGPNVKLSSKDTARIGNYTVTHGMSAEPTASLIFAHAGCYNHVFT